jgi:hypothetical protein
MRPRSFLALVVLAAPLPAAAQSGGTAHLYAYRLSDKPAFEAGYRKHLEWHARIGDKLVWYAWYVTAGDRAGAFIDGTFGTTPERLENRPRVKEDGVDFRANAAAYAAAIGNEGWELWREASQVQQLEQRKPQALVQVHAVAVTDAKRFEAALLARPVIGASWYRGIGETPGPYLLIAPVAAADTRPDLAALLGADHPALAFARAVRSEAWTYAPRLALFPGEPLAP